MAIQFNPDKIISKVLPKTDQTFLTGELKLKNSLKKMLLRTDWLGGQDINKTVDSTLNFYNRKMKELKEEGIKNFKQDALNDEKLLKARVSDAVVERAAELIKERYKGKEYIWLPSDAEIPDPVHALNYGKTFIVGEGEMPGERYGCRCGMEIQSEEIGAPTAIFYSVRPSTKKSIEAMQAKGAKDYLASIAKASEAEKEKIEAEKAKAEKERLELEAKEKERLEKEAAEKAEKEKTEKEKLEKEAAEKAEQERVEKEKELAKGDERPSVGSLSKKEARQEERVLDKLVEKEQIELAELNKAKKGKKLNDEEIEQLKVRNAEQKIKRQRLDALHEVRLQRVKEKVLKRQERQQRQKISPPPLPPEIVKVENKEIDIAPAKQQMRDYADDVTTGKAKEEEIILKDIPASKGAQKILDKHANFREWKKEHSAGISKVQHVINDHIKTGELTSQEFELIPEILIKGETTFEPSRKNGVPNRIKYTYIKNGQGYIYIEDIPGKRIINRKDKRPLLKLKSFYREYDDKK
jgi:hypothetical protein